jgi:hypothetical protein
VPSYNHFVRDAQGNHSPVGLAVTGPHLAVEIHIPNALAAAMAAANQPIPAPIVGVALIDTGASRSAVNAATAILLGVQQVGVGTGYTAGGPVQQSLYPVRFAFPGIGLDVQFNAATGVDLTGQTCAGQPMLALIGRDVLANCVFIYNGPAGTFTLSW